MINLAGRQPVVVTKDSLKEIFADRYVNPAIEAMNNGDVAFSVASAEVFLRLDAASEKIGSTLDNVLEIEATKSNIRAGLWRRMSYMAILAGFGCWEMGCVLNNQSLQASGAACIGAAFIGAAKALTEERLECDLDAAVSLDEHEFVMPLARRERLLKTTKKVLLADISL